MSIKDYRKLTNQNYNLYNIYVIEREEKNKLTDKIVDMYFKQLIIDK